MPLFAVEVLFPDDLAHGFHVNLAFHPGHEVQVRKGPGFKTIFFEMFDLLQELFELDF